MQWDTALRDKNRLQEEAQKVRYFFFDIWFHSFENFKFMNLNWSTFFLFLFLFLLLQLREKNEELLKEMNTQMAESQNLNKDFKRLQVFINFLPVFFYFEYIFLYKVPLD